MECAEMSVPENGIFIVCVLKVSVRGLPLTTIRHSRGPYKN